MKNTPFASRRSIHQSTFSPDLSSKRLNKIQNLLKNSSLEGILTILGIDSRYNDGCRKLANYLLFGFCKLNLEQFDEVEIAEEDLEDLVILVRKTSVSVYCCSTLYHYILPYIAHWRNLEVHCLPAHEQEEIDEDAIEEFKIKSLVAMLHDVINVGIPYMSARKSSDSSGFNMLALEKWPLIQSYALEGVGGGKFFTMQFNVVSVHEELVPIYEECDPADLERVLVSALPLLERHWAELLSCIGGSCGVAKLDVSEKDVAEPLVSYFNHGRLTAMQNGTSPRSTAKPVVCFGTRTENFEDQTPSPTATLQNSGWKKNRALHMVIQGVSPRKPLCCCRTYFLTPQNQTEMRDVALMVSLYRECVRACKDAIAKYSLNSDVTKSCSVANKILSSACSNYCPSAEHDCKLEVLDNANRSLKQGDASFHVKRISVRITGVRGEGGEMLGSLCYSDTFVNSALHVEASRESKEDTRNTDSIVLTSGIPTFVQWRTSADELRSDSSVFAKLTGAYLCSNAVLLGYQGACDVEVHSDGGMLVRPQHAPPFLLPPQAITELLSFNPDPATSVALLQFGLRPGSAIPVYFGRDPHLALGFYPQTSAWKTFNNIVEPHFTQTGLLSATDRIDPALAPFHADLQTTYEWTAGHVHRAARANALSKVARSLQPQLTTFLRHYSASFILSGSAVPRRSVDELVGEEVNAGGEPARDNKVCITVVCGLPGSHADKLCSAMVALHKEKVRWVVVKVRARNGNAQVVDQEHLQTQLTELVAKRRATRPGVAATKRLRIIVEAVGFFDVSSVLSCVLNHKDASVRGQMHVGAVTSCVEPVAVYVEHSRLFPNVLEQCAAGVVNNVAFTGALDDLKDQNLAVMQGMVRNVNADAAFLLAPSGNVQRTGDFDRVLSETSFDSEESRKRRLLSVPGIWNGTFTPHPAALPVCEVTLQFSQPLLRGTLCARLRALRHTLAPFPFAGNVYMVMGVVKFTDVPSGEETRLCFVTRTGNLDLEAQIQAGIAPAPPSGRASVAARPYHLRFYGIDLVEEVLRDWLRKCGRQAPSKKAHRSRESLSKGERKKIQALHQQDSLPEGVFFNGSHYCNLSDNSRSYEHPCLETFIDEYLAAENDKIDEYNVKVEAQCVPDMFL